MTAAIVALLGYGCIAWLVIGVEVMSIICGVFVKMRINN